MNMVLDRFIGQFEDAIDGLHTGTVVKDTRFRMLEEWSSLAVLTVLAMVEEEYGLHVSGCELEESETVEALFNVIVGKARSGSD